MNSCKTETERLEEAVAGVSQAMSEMCHAISKVIASVVDDFTASFSSCLPIIAAYQAAAKEHPQWVHMACHARKKRIRKKYHDRIMRKYGRCNGE